MHASPPPREFDWPQLSESAPILAATMTRYLDQIALSLQPSTISAIDGILRRFAGYLTSHHPEIKTLADVERIHIEAFKKYLPTRPGKNGRPPLARSTIGMTLGILRTFFERVSEWDYPDAPGRVLIFNGDLPVRDETLPKFLTDTDAAKLMRTVAEEEPVRRLVIEMLARTGLRIGELCDLTADAVAFISGRHWLRVPIGKLHNDRYIPLHPLLVELLNQHQNGRTDDYDRLILWNGRPVDRHHITRALNRAAKIAGIGHVHPHQLRHTFATQAINRGMSLEAIAAMLGHKTLRMTLVYARIADRTVADAYDTVTTQIDALYTKPTGLRPSGDGSTTMEQLAAEYDQRMLGNGYCNRPSQLDCQFESICENCAHYSTDNTFNHVLVNQRDHAKARDQHQRIDLFEMLITRNQKAAQ